MRKVDAPWEVVSARHHYKVQIEQMASMLLHVLNLNKATPGFESERSIGVALVEIATSQKHVHSDECACFLIENLWNTLALYADETKGIKFGVHKDKHMIGYFPWEELQ